MLVLVSTTLCIEIISVVNVLFTAQIVLSRSGRSAAAISDAVGFISLTHHCDMYRSNLTFTAVHREETFVLGTFAAPIHFL